MIVLLFKSFGYLQTLIALGFALFFLTLTGAGRRELGLRIWIVFVLLTIVSFFSPTLWLVHLVAFMMIPAMARTRRDVALMLIVASLASPPFYNALALGDLRLVRWSVQSTLALGALFGFAIARGPIMKPKLGADMPFLLLMVLLVVVAARESSATNVAREICTAIGNFAVPYWVITRSLNPWTDSRRLMLWITAACAMISVIALYEAMTSWPLYRIAGSLFEFRGAGMFVMRMGFMRAAGPLANSTVLGFVLAFGFAAAILSRRWFHSAAHQGWVVALIGAGVIASQSRGAMLGAAMAALLLAIYNPRGRKGMLALVAIVLATLLSLLMIGLTTYEATAADTITYRRQLMQRGIEEFWKHPLAGDTIAAVTERLRDLTTGEHIVDFVNTYLYFALFTGIFGAIAFLYVLLRPSMGLWWAKDRLPDDPDYITMARFCFAVLIASAFMLGFTSLSDRMATTLVAMIGLAGIVAKPGRRPEPKRAPLPVAEPAFPGLPGGAMDEMRLPQIREQELPRG